MLKDAEWIKNENLFKLSSKHLYNCTTLSTAKRCKYRVKWPGWFYHIASNAHYFGVFFHAYLRKD